MPYSAEEMRARVLFRDAERIVLDKPPGLPVHFGTKTVWHLEQFLPFIQDGDAEPPRLCHRLDKDTSGCLLLARSAEAAARAARHFLSRRIGKVYWAVVEGAPPRAEGTIDLPLMKVHIPGMSKVVVTPEGKPALTDWRVMGQAGGLTWLELTPRTGRMHQLRAHCAFSGFPMLGDPIYGSEIPAPVPLHLHARTLTLPGLATDAPVRVEAPPPPHFADTLAAIAPGTAPAAGCYPAGTTGGGEDDGGDDGDDSARRT